MTDNYGRKIQYLRLSVTELCNLRCRYCMPEEGICKKRCDEMLTEDEMILAVQAAASLGVEKLRITGGEPLVKPNILSTCRRAAAVDGIKDLCVTTNGLMLPELAADLKAAGVKRVNISLDTLNADKYAYMTRGGELKQAIKGLEAAMSTGFQQVKINTVLIGGYNEEEIVELGELTRQYPVDVRFIELMPMYDGGDFGQEAYLPCSAVLEQFPQALAQAFDGGVARLYRLPGAKGNIGLISAVSQHFCALCNRVRLTADGKIKPCLHSSQEFSIKGLGMEDMQEQFRQAVAAKPENHAQLSFRCRSQAGRNMNQIGG